MSELEGFEDELAFWRGAIQRQKAGTGATYLARKLDPTRPLQPQVAARIGPKEDGIRILDVGCGPASTLGKVWKGRPVELTGLDPLGDAYQRLFDEENLARPHPIVTGVAEEAAKHFGPAAFDYVHVENALDHCQDPFAALSQLHAVCRPDGTIYVQVFVNEGAHNHYNGFHQWNFDLYDGRVIFWRPEQIHFLDEVLQQPVRCWRSKTEINHGDGAVPRDILHFEIHATDMTQAVARGPLMVRTVPGFRALVLDRTEAFDPEVKVFLHFQRAGAERHVETIRWLPDRSRHVVPFPDGDVQSILMGQFTMEIDPVGTPTFHNIWEDQFTV